MIRVESGFDDILSSSLLAWERLWMMPFVVGSCWWNVVVDTAWPRGHARRSWHETHDQLPVPAPIEADGEKALFA